MQEKPRRSNVRLLQQQGVPSGESSKVPKRSRKHPADDARAKNPLPNHAKLVRAPAERRKRPYRADRQQQNHAKDRELGDGRNRRGLLGNALSVAANGVSRSIRERLAVRTRKSSFRISVALFKGTCCLCLSSKFIFCLVLVVHDIKRHPSIRIESWGHNQRLKRRL